VHNTRGDVFTDVQVFVYTHTIANIQYQQPIHTTLWSLYSACVYTR